MSRSFFHDSRDPIYRRPYGAVPCGSAVALSFQAMRYEAPLTVRLRIWSTSLGEQVQDPVRIAPVEGVADRIAYEFEVCAPDTPGLLWYHFIVSYADYTVQFGAPNDGLGGAGTEYEAVPADWQITVYAAKTRVPDWYTHGIMYQIFPDRFYRGDSPPPLPELPQQALYHLHWNDWPFYAKDPQTGNLAAYDFFGGTLDGVIDKLTYLKSLGVSILYLNPIFQSVSNHKYDTGDYKTIDAQFGGNEGFARLQTAAAAVGIRLILDGVFSHNGVDSLYFQSAIRSKKSPYFPWYRFSEYPDKYDCWWGVTTLPNVNEMEPSYRRFINSGKDSVIKHWLDKGAAGWRLDVVDELPGEFVQEMYRELKRAKPDAVLIGEVWEDASRKESYGKLREYLWGHELDSVINYPFRSAVLDYLTGRLTAAAALRQLASLSENYPAPYFYATMNVLGTHDVPRALTVLGEAPPETALTKLEQACYQLPETRRKLALARLKLAALIQFASPGVPCVYYGDEAGVEGHSDPQNRRTYPWGDENAELVEWYRRLALLRQSEPVLRTGRWVPLDGGDEVFAFGRRSDEGRDALGDLIDDAAMVVMVNRSDRPVDCCLDISQVCRGPMRSVLPAADELQIPDADGRLRLRLPPLSAVVLKAGLHPMFSQRQAGILLHPTSLPGPYGIGDLGPGAHAFIDWLAAAKQSLWQILPLTPVDSTGSPYQSASAFAGNPLLISPQLLVEQGLLTKQQAEAGLCPAKVEYEKVVAVKQQLLQQAFASFRRQPAAEPYWNFCREAAFWLDDYALFMALKDRHDGVAWTEWTPDVARREPAALERARQELAVEIEFYRFCQYLFFSQWQQLRQRANKQGIRIIGDLPIFVAHDSADVWSCPELFALDANGRTKTRAGVPPDYFSETGQLWGNPHYNWKRHAKTDYSWWVSRLRWLFKAVDAVRIDHFRGFEAFWEIPARAKTAVTGRWVKGPGEAFFHALWRQLGPTPIIAEDLGVITPEVVQMKDSFFLPGMVILQFEIWPEAAGFHLPSPSPNSIFYSGTHDNDTLLGWLRQVRKTEPELFAGAAAYAGRTPKTAPASLVGPLLQQLMQSQARIAVVPLQDWLGLGTDARMNMPSTASGNWAWRLSGDELTTELAARIAAVVEASGRD
jgi:4-alpha-glucanotransferase